MGKFISNYVTPEMENKLRPLITPKRFDHSVGVAKTALTIASKYGIDEKKCVLAGFLHDCAKDMPESRITAYLKKYKINLDDITKKTPALRHSLVGPYAARDIFGVRDHEILDAIKYHTSGNRRMCPVAKVVFVADYTEINRKHRDSKKIRSKIWTDITLDELVKNVLKDKLSFLLEEGKLIHPDAIRMWNCCCK
jgi:predicted HD superfamily hydrolase involved in NAD metabolism